MIVIIDQKGQKKLINEQHIVSASIRENSMKHNFTVTITLVTKEEETFRVCTTSAEAAAAMDELIKTVIK